MIMITFIIIINVITTTTILSTYNDYENLIKLNDDVKILIIITIIII